MQLELIEQEPAAPTRETPILFIHGMWHGAWCWVEHFLPYFAERGYKAYALSLRGHGASEGRSRLRWTPLSAYVADVARVVDSLESPPVLIGNSMGGMVVQKYLEDHPAPAAVLLASVPTVGVLPVTLRVARRQPRTFLKANMTLSLFHVVGTPQLYREAFFSDQLPEARLASYHSRIQDESYRAYLDMMGFNRAHPRKVKTPVLVLGGADDNLTTAGETKRTARAYHTQAEFFAGTGHGMMLDAGWQAVADRILDWLGERGL